MNNAVSRTSGSATATRVISLLSTRVLPLASRISPRGADNEEAKKCWRLARAAHCFPSTTCTFAACAMRVMANSTKKPWTTAARLGAFILPRPWEYDYLLIGRNMHPKAALDGSAQRLPARRVANLGIEACPLALQRDALRVQHGETLGLADADGSPPYDRERYKDESAQHQPNQAAPSQSYAALRHARSLALRERGLVLVSM